MRYQLLCLAVFVITYLLNITYITVFYHRGLTHGAVRLSPFARRLVALTGNWVTGLDPKGWVCMHRLHHLHSDTDLDPHTPRRFGIFGLMLGQLESYKGVLRKLGKKDPATVRIVSDLDFPVSWLNRKKLWYAPYLLHAAVALACGAAGMWLLGYAYFAGMMSHPIQGWMVNAFGHAMGYRNFATGDDSRNNTLVAWLVMGEGFQNNHHRFPKAAKFSVRWFELDMGYGLCLALDAVGLIKITRQPEAEAVPIELAASSY
jgi:stearoyl-CoA desaturase (delta-9 desaturase)